MGENLRRCERRRVTEDVNVMQLNFSKQKKLYSEIGNEYRGDLELVENAVSPAASRTSGCCKFDESINEVVRRSFGSPDLENVDWQSDGFGMEISTSINGVFSREATPTSELWGDSEQMIVMDSSSASPRQPISPPPACPRKKFSASAARSTPSAAELEEFFTVAEKYVQKSFSEKYNYDIVKDVPLEGRYQWVRLHP